MPSEVKERILEVAAQLFMEQGFAATSVREIGERAGIGQSSLYHHVRSKGHLLQALHEVFIQQLNSELHRVMASEGTPSEQLRDIVRVVLTVVETHQPEVTVFLRESHALPKEMRRKIQRERDEVDVIVTDVLNRGIESGEFRKDLDIPLSRLAILGMCNWSYQWFRPGGTRSIDEISTAFADFALRGVLADPSAL
jgi:AcrR family transcriptional regulator